MWLGSNMEYEIFEGKKPSLFDGRTSERDYFDKLRKELGFEEANDFLCFCIALGMSKYSHISPKNIDLSETRFSSPVDVKVFGEQRAKLLDFILILLKGEEENRMKEIKKCAFCGLNTIHNWYEDKKDELGRELRNFSYLMEDLGILMNES